MGLNWLIGFLFIWQQLIGTFLGIVGAVWGSVWLNNFLIKRRERKRQYSNLLLVLHELQYFIGRYETYLDFKKRDLASFNTIAFGPELNYMESSQVFNLNSEVYINIQMIHKIAQEIMYILEHSEAVTTEVKKLKNREIHTQDNVLSGRYHKVVAFVETYLVDSYKRFNSIIKEIKNLSKKYKYTFPETIKPYTKDYVNQKIKEYKLKT